MKLDSILAESSVMMDFNLFQIKHISANYVNGKFYVTHHKNKSHGIVMCFLLNLSRPLLFLEIIFTKKVCNASNAKEHLPFTPSFPLPFSPSLCT